MGGAHLPQKTGGHMAAASDLSPRSTSKSVHNCKADLLFLGLQRSRPASHPKSSCGSEWF